MKEKKANLLKCYTNNNMGGKSMIKHKLTTLCIHLQTTEDMSV